MSDRCRGTLLRRATAGSVKVAGRGERGCFSLFQRVWDEPGWIVRASPPLGGSRWGRSRPTPGQPPLHCNYAGAIRRMQVQINRAGGQQSEELHDHHRSRDLVRTLYQRPIPNHQGFPVLSALLLWLIPVLRIPVYRFAPLRLSPPRLAHRLLLGRHRYR